MPPAAPPGYTPYASAQQAPNYASFWARLGGYLLDGLLYGMVLSIFAVPAAILGWQSVKDCTRTTVRNNTSISCSGNQLNGGYLAGAIVLGLIGIVVVGIIYFRALGHTGQTWGRKIVGVKVVDAKTGNVLGIGRAIGRQLAQAIVSGNCVLGYLWMLWDKEKQTWHDKIIGSIVVRV
jgi:uncharacterized RDD family membrane protein YckC